MASIELGQPDGAQPTGAQPQIPETGPARVTIPVIDGIIPVKTSAETLYLKFDWSGAIDDGLTLQSVEHTVPGGVVREDQSVEGSSSLLDVSGGGHAAIYQLTIFATLSDASTVSKTWPLRIFNS